MQSRNRGKMHIWRLSGLIIGNGWIDGQTQYPAYMEYAIANNLIPDSALEPIQQKQKACLRELADGGKDHVHSPSCSNLIGDILMLSQHDGQCFNMYDIRKWDEFPRCGMGSPLELLDLSAYMQRKDVMEILHVDPSSGRWEECRSDVGAAFTVRNSLPSSRLLPELISEMPVLLYAGDKDFACNHLGLERFVEALGWNDSSGPFSMRDQDPSLAAWVIDDRTIGQWYSKNNLTYVRHYNASHMVPYDHPQQAKQMISRFLEANLRAEKSSSFIYVGSNVTLHSHQETDANQWAWILFGISVLVVGFMLVIAIVEVRSIAQ
jgi:carboxypeptidase D